jgi:ferredoxin
MRATITLELCQGHALCHAFAPDVYVIEADGTARVVMDTIPPELEVEAESAARCCPTAAIVIHRD